MTDIAMIRAAAERLQGHARRTPLLSSPFLDRLAGRRVLVKPECLQRVGAFKFRGALNALARLRESGSGRGVLAYSSGNHAQAIALALTFVLVWPSAGLAAVIAGILLSLAGTYILAFWTRRQIGGRTGDTLGACQQIALVSFLTGVAAAT